ncbi:MAG: NAD(P)/FAD-dependent oxidoreductase [Thioalkalivibrio sp.]|nr:NAD(P)/FAD-dependent oxidoreductase [Thioalkalivibrio sp.]
MRPDATIDTQVLIVGAGPAGTAAAIALRQAGVDVTLADRCDFPRDKACGDALMPDAVQALSRLDLKERVLASASRPESIRIHAPDGSPIELHGDFACLPRRVLDHGLLEAARDAGARFLPGHRAVAPLPDRGRVRGALLAPPGVRPERRVRARLTVLATGASPAPLRDFGVLLRRDASAIALRAYFRVPDRVAGTFGQLHLSYEQAICPGYGWVFPGPENVFNVGVGVFRDGLRPSDVPNLRDVWKSFVRDFRPAREIVAAGDPLAPPRGAPLRCNLAGAQFHRPGLLVVGEAAGLTFPFSGEGIGKALESGLIAAAQIASALQSGRDDSEPDHAGADYERNFRALHAGRYQGYRRAQSWLAWPAVCNLIARHAGPGSFAASRLEEMIEERTDPRELFSPSGLLRALFSSVSSRRATS